MLIFPQKQSTFNRTLNLRFRVPYPGQWGLPKITLAGFVAMISAVVASIFESLGDYYACAKIAQVQHPPKHAVNRFE